MYFVIVKLNIVNFRYNKMVFYFFLNGEYVLIINGSLLKFYKLVCEYMYRYIYKKILF